MALFMMFVVHNNRLVKFTTLDGSMCAKLEYGIKHLRLKHVQEIKIVTSWEIGAKYM